MPDPVAARDQLTADVPSGDLPTRDTAPPLDLPTDTGVGFAHGSVGGIDGFELTGELGRGGMGVVYLARDSDLDREVAVKVLGTDLAPGSSAETRFLEEAKITAKLQHPGIPPVYRVGRLADGRPFLAMKLIRGRTLAELLAEQGHGGAKWLAAFEGVCQAVGYAHAAGYIHRDLKPQNVMVGAFGEVQVMDWGLAKRLAPSGRTGDVSRLGDQTQATHVAGSPDPNDTRPGSPDTSRPDTAPDGTQAGSVMGTPTYMAPEQARGEIDRLDRRTDVFALGCILCKLLTGSTPFTGSVMEVMRAAVAGDLSDAFARLDACGEEGELVALAKRCLSADPDDRPADASAVAAAVAAFRGEAEARAKRAELDRGKAEVRAAEQRKRGRVLLSSGAAVAAVLLAGLGVSLWQMLRATTAEGQAKTNELTATQNAETAERNAKDARDERDARDTALKGEVKAKEEAQTSLARSKRSFLILSSAFTALDPRNPAQTLGDLRTALKNNLHRAVAELEGEATGDPLQVADMQNTLGNALLGLGDAERAIQVFSKALATRTEKLGADHPDALSALNNLAQGYAADGNADKALPILRECYTLMKRNLGTDHPDTLRALGTLALGYAAAGQRDKALPLQEECYTLTKRKQGADHPDTLAALNNLAAGYLATGQRDKALPLLQECHRLMKGNLGADHPDTLRALGNLAEGYVNAGKADKALPLQEECYTLRKGKLGADHPDTLHALNNLAEGYAATGQRDKAVPLLEECHRLLKGKQGPDHPDTLAVLKNLADAYAEVGKGEKAADAYTAYLDAKRKQAPRPGVTFASDLVTSSWNLLKCGQHAFAEPLLRECLSIYEKEKPDAWGNLIARPLLGAALLAQKKYADAEPLLVKGYEELMGREKTIPKAFESPIPETLDRLTELYTVTGKADEAKKYAELRAKYPAAKPAPAKREVLPPPREVK